MSLLRDPTNNVYVSSASAWEVATKYRIGKYPQCETVISEWNERITVDSFTELCISSAHALRAGSLLGEHRDPFDRMIAAQGIIETLSVVTPDTAVEDLGAERIW